MKATSTNHEPNSTQVTAVGNCEGGPESTMSSKEFGKHPTPQT